MFVDGFINYIMGVEFHDKFRYNLLRDDINNQMNATVYHIESQWIKKDIFFNGKVPYCINIIEIPDFKNNNIADKDLIM